MPSKTEQMLMALAVRLRTVPKAKVERNTAVPERIPKGGLIVLPPRRGKPAGAAAQAIASSPCCFGSGRATRQTSIPATVDGGLFRVLRTPEARRSRC